MSLSVNKLDNMLVSKGLIPKKYFAMKQSCVYIEVLILETADSFLLYIPSKYDVLLKDGTDVYNMDYLEIAEDGNVTDDFAGEPDNFELEKQYDGVDLAIDPTNKTKDLASALEESYNHPVALKDVTNKDKSKIKEIFRQLRRLKFCVQGIRYKLCILYKNFMCCIRRDDTFEGFTISGHPGVPSMRLLVTLDLENLYEKLDSVAVDVTTVREGVCNVLDKTHHKHTTNLTKMLSQKDVLTNSADMVTTKKARYSVYLARLGTMLTAINITEAGQLDKLARIEEHYKVDVSVKGLHSDIERSHQMAKINSEIDKVNAVKEEVVRTIVTVKRGLENLSLEVDRICFDNTIMIDAIIKNFIQLSAL